MKEDKIISFKPEVFYDVINNQEGALEKNYLEFLELDDSFMGWLLTLNKDEFAQVFASYLAGRGMGLHFVELAHKDIWQVLESEVTKRIEEHRVYIKTAFMIKEGYYDYEAGATDSTWKIKITEKGRALEGNPSLINQLRRIQKRAKDYERKRQGDNPDGPGLEIV